MNSPQPGKLRVRWFRFQFRLRTLLVMMVVASLAFSWLGVVLRRQRIPQLDKFAMDAEWDPDGNVVAVSFPYPILGMDHWTLTDADMVHLEPLVHLTRLGLEGTEVTDAGLAHVSVLDRLQQLSLRGTRITDAGLVHLEPLVGLEHLYLTNTRVSDRGLGHLQKLVLLKNIVLRGTQVTDEGVQRLLAALPRASANLAD